MALEPANSPGSDGGNAGAALQWWQQQTELSKWDFLYVGLSGSAHGERLRSLLGWAGQDAALVLHEPLPAAEHTAQPCPPGTCP